MSSRVVGSAGICFRLALYSDDLAELKVGMRCTTVFEMSSQSWSQSLFMLSFSWYIDGIGFTSIYAASVDMIQYLFGDDSCMVCWVSVLVCRIQLVCNIVV
jgi:hypothetical protein